MQFDPLTVRKMVAWADVTQVNADAGLIELR